MQFICGVVKNDKVLLIAAESSPSLDKLNELTGGGLPIDAYGWGPEASEAACRRTARAVLALVTDRDEAQRLCSAYAMAVVRTMSPSQMWLLSYEEILGWIATQRKVA